MTGYSDRINHALAYAAKHHDREVRKGTRAPYLTQPANVAVILTRYGCDEDTVVAGILHDVIENCLRDGWTRAMLDDRIGEKFGAEALDAALAVARRKLDDRGNELDRDERNADLIERLGAASERAHWVCAADNLHNGNSLLADLRRTVDSAVVWGRATGGRASTVRWYRDVYEGLKRAAFAAPVMQELETMVGALESTP